MGAMGDGEQAERAEWGGQEPQSIGHHGARVHGGQWGKGSARSGRRAGMHWGPLKSFDWVWRHRARGPWDHGARSHK